MYTDTWESCINEELVCKRKRHNVYDPFAVAVVNVDNIVDLLLSIMISYWLEIRMLKLTLT